jgi:DNA-directed RNA polymerase specialized sigma24 family protein
MLFSFHHLSERRHVSAEKRVSDWLKDLKAGDPEAVQKIWENYFKRLVAIARKKLPLSSRRAFDEEDIALSAFHSFCQGVERGRFPQLEDRNDLWRVLLVITVRKAQFYVRRESRQKRGHGLVQAESAADAADFDRELAELVSQEPTPELATQLAEECQRLLGSLNDSTLRSIALMKLEGYTVEEISSRVGCARRSVERRLQLIRAAWSADSPILEPLT